MHDGKTYHYVLAEINDTHEVLDRHGIPRTHHGERLSLAQRARLLEKSLTEARIKDRAAMREGGIPTWRRPLG